MKEINITYQSKIEKWFRNAHCQCENPDGAQLSPAKRQAWCTRPPQFRLAKAASGRYANVRYKHNWQRATGVATNCGSSRKRKFRTHSLIRSDAQLWNSGALATSAKCEQKIHLLLLRFSFRTDCRYFMADADADASVSADADAGVCAGGNVDNGWHT